MIEHITLVRCDRCGDKIAATEGHESDPRKELSLSLMVDDTALSYTDLCKRCMKLAQRCLKDLAPTDGKRKTGES